MTAPVAIVVVSWNTRGLLARALASMEPDVQAGRATVTVVDNASRDGSAELVAQRYPRARVIRSPENLGFGRAVNLGTAAALAESSPPPRFIAAANADVELRPGAVGALLAAAEADPGAGALAPRLRLPDGSTQHSVHPFPTLSLLSAFNLGRPRRDPEWGDRQCLEGYWDPEVPRRVPWAVGAFLLIRAEAWQAVGGFNEEQFMYAEDLDLGYRLARSGWATRYVPEAVVEHHHEASTTKAFGAETVDRWQEASYAWIRATHGRRQVAAIAAVNAAGAGVRALDPQIDPAARAELRAWVRRHLGGLRRSLT